ncbi:hypothetical protein [Bdellovibrio bacteriovorus]|uniref:hypothetical protein n=1 Tax=Bdellovibrio bacteriovorus TaxID=959 RepID=UPI000A4CA34F|nr:hypothetical protein [Bdellovibrio bacteriovorus]
MSEKIQSKSSGKRNFTSWKAFLCLGFLLYAPSSLGAYETVEETIIRQNVNVSEWLDSVADGLDVFLAGERYTQRPNKTIVTLESSGYYTELDGTSGAFNFNIDLRLPNVEEYWQLTFTSYDENEERDAKTKYLRTEPRERNYGASLSLFKRMGDIRTSFQPRITFEGTPAISHSLKFETIVEEKSYRINPELEFYATPGKGAGIFEALNFNWPLSAKYSVTLINEGDYQSRPHIFTVTNGLSLGQSFSKSRSLSYAIFVTSSNRPNYQLAGYNFSVTWRHIVLNRILDYDIIPNIDFVRETNFVRNPGVTVNVNLHF